MTRIAGFCASTRSGRGSARIHRIRIARDLVAVRSRSNLNRYAIAVAGQCAALAAIARAHGLRSAGSSRTARSITMRRGTRALADAVIDGRAQALGEVDHHRPADGALRAAAR